MKPCWPIMIARTSGFSLAILLHRQPQLESRAHPRDVSHLAAVDLLGQRLAAPARRDGDDGVRVHVIDVLARA